MRMQIRQSWLRGLFDQFAEGVILRSPQPIKVLERNLPCWMRIDLGVRRQTDLTKGRVAEILSVAECRRWSSTMQFLQRHGVTLPDVTDRRDRAEQERTEATLQAEEPLVRRWLERYHRHLASPQHKALASQTRRVYLRAARNLLEAPGADPRVDTFQAALATHLGHHPGDRASLTRFVRFLSEMGVTATIPSQGVTGKGFTLSGTVKRVRLALSLANEESPARRRAGIAALMIQLYDVEAREVLQIQRDDIRESVDGLMWTRKSRQPLALDPRIAPLLHRWIEETGNQNRLFDNPDTGEPISEGTLWYHLTAARRRQRRAAREAGDR